MRRREERTRVTAQAREADAIMALARALGQAQDAGLVERVLPRLTERTQYAVRKQLGLIRSRA